MRYRIIDTRGSGKTSRLMLLAKETKSTIVCSNPYAMRQKALAYGIVGIDFISYKDFIDGDYSSYENIMIDELETFVAFYLCQGHKLTGYTLSMED